MPNTNNANNQSNKNQSGNNNQTNNNQSNTTSVPKGASVVIGCDSNSNDQKMIDTVAKGVQDAGYNVAEKFAVGPSPFSTYAYTNAAKDKIGIYLMADSLFSFADGYHDLYAFDIFVIRGGVGGGINSQQDFDTKTLGADPDCNSACDEWVGLSYPQMNEKAKGKCLAVYGGKTPEEALQATLNALSGAGAIATGGNTTSGNTGVGGAVKIPDVTFYGLIKQIIGAVDGLFIIANNLAYLLTFKDMFQHRIDNDDVIPTIEPSDVIDNTMKKNWTTAGYYNAVEVTYADGTMRYQHDTLVKQYGEHVYYYDCEADDYETAKAKAQALLSAHVRDYSTDVELQVFYNPNITAGSWIKLKKSITQISGKTLKEKQQEQLKAQGKKIETKRKGINITNITEEVVKKDDITKKIRHLTDEKGKKIDVEEEQSDYDFFFVQSYNCKWDKYNSLIMNLYLKYGPDTPEDPISASVGGTGSIGTSNTTGGNTSVGGQAADINEFVQKALQGVPNDEQSKVNAIYKAMVAIIRYDLYSCSKYKTPSECLKNASHLNCADSSRLGRACYAAAGLKAQVVHGPDHFWVEVQVNGQTVSSDVTGPQGGACVRDLNEIYNGLTKDGDCGDEPSC